MVSRVRRACVSPVGWIIIINIILLNTIFELQKIKNYKCAIIREKGRGFICEDVYTLIRMLSLLILYMIDGIIYIFLAFGSFTFLFCFLFCQLLHGHYFESIVFSYCFCSCGLLMLIFQWS